jgi:hypothetical protein
MPRSMALSGAEANSAGGFKPPAFFFESLALMLKSGDIHNR